MRIFKADLFHLFKDKLFYLLLILTLILPLATCIISNNMGTEKMTIDSFIFQCISSDILYVIIGIQLSSFIGREYENNTIRNKICYGEGKIKVAIAFLIETMIIAFIFILISLISSFLFGFIFCKYSFEGGFFPKLICQSIIIISFSVCVSSVVIGSKSMKAGFIFVVLISIILGAISYIFPIRASSNEFIAILSRCLYMVVSYMMLKSNNGIYQVAGYSFNHLYLNAVLISVIYLIVSSLLCLLTVRKHEYK